MAPPQYKKIGPWVLSSFGGLHEIRWIFSGHEIRLISCTRGGFHEIRWISWKSKFQNVKFLKHL